MRLRALAIWLIALTSCGRSGFSPEQPEPLTIPTPLFDPLSSACLAASNGPLTEVGSIATDDSAFGVWYLHPYIILGETNGGVRAYTFDGATFTETDRLTAIGWVEALWSDGQYLFVSAPGTGLWVYTLSADGLFTLVTSETTLVKQARQAWGDGRYIYVPAGDDGLYAFSFDGTTLTPVGTKLDSSGWSSGVRSSSTEIYFADYTSLRTLSFDGSAFHETIAEQALSVCSRIWLDDASVFAATSTGVAAFERSASGLVPAGATSFAAAGRNMWFDGQHLFVAGDDGFYVLSYASSAFTVLEQLSTKTLGVFGDGTYIYVGAAADGLKAYSGYACESF